MKLRSFLNVLTAVVLALLSTGVGGLVWLTAQSPLGLLREGQSQPNAAMFVSKQAPAMVSLLVNPDRLESFRVSTARPGDRRRARAEIAQLKQTLIGWTGLDYEADIQSWLGDEITLAVTAPDFDRDAENGEQPGYLLALASQEPERARQFLQLFWQKQAIAGVDLVFEQFAGVKLIYGSEGTMRSAPTPLASAIVGDRYVLFANHPKVLRDAINNVQAPGLSLSGSSPYQQALDSLPDRQIGLAFVDLPQLSRWLDRSKSAIAVSANGDRLYESLVMALRLTRQGLVGDTALLTAAGQQLAPQRAKLSQPVGALRYVPADSSLAAAGTDLQQFWQQLSTGLQGYDRAARLADQILTDFESQWGLERSDMVDWVQGEFAFSLLEASPRTRPEWIFVAEKSAAAAAELERLNAIAQQRGLTAGAVPLGDQTIYAWTKLSAANRSNTLAVNADVQGVHATVGNYEIFASSIAAIDRALSAEQRTLLDSTAFREAIAALKSPNDGYFYLDWQALQKQIERQFPLVKLVKLAGKPVLDHVESIAVSSYGSEADVRRGGVLLRLADAI